MQRRVGQQLRRTRDDYWHTSSGHVPPLDGQTNENHVGIAKAHFDIPKALHCGERTPLGLIRLVETVDSICTGGEQNAPNLDKSEKRYSCERFRTSHSVANGGSRMLRGLEVDNAHSVFAYFDKAAVRVNAT